MMRVTIILFKKVTNMATRSFGSSLFLIASLLFISACSSTMETKNSNFIADERSNQSSKITLHVCRPASMLQGHATGGLAINDEAVTEIGNNEKYAIDIPKTKPITIDFYLPKLSFVDKKQKLSINLTNPVDEIYLLSTVEHANTKAGIVMLALIGSGPDFRWGIRITKEAEFKELCDKAPIKYFKHKTI